MVKFSNGCHGNDDCYNNFSFHFWFIFVSFCSCALQQLVHANTDNNLFFLVLDYFALVKDRFSTTFNPFS